MHTKPPTIETRIIDVLSHTSNASAWEIANHLYNNCMHTPNPSNGARIATIVKACHKSSRISMFFAGNDERRYFLTPK